ncbi:DNA-deoxyinosine glycosylase [Gracilibacillus caseinilyticus]|uniref:DNA-deoxyinosine glycosylase n=1 Tax=Gracilibacillus caseinilyticus TaxID=2932256 RepID=A0ABY4EY10_9BACI|nr:DNA-deoxyinosine glycosylase [Gracilibacillus caseinilyticus]UOQ48738.1 DNA-deoxyinosine glycosylase [Gracilibacillus caseinilyticus]
MANQKIHSLDPIIDQHANILILGSIPGKQSLMKQQYYGNSRNHFWPILFEIYEREWIENYEDKVAFLHEKAIALWDVIGACYREGSLDSNITEAEPNSLEDLLDTYPAIQRIGCNGTKAYQTFRKHFAHLIDRYDVRKLPSTSPIPGRYNKTFEEKVDVWKDIFEE